ncbi:MAG TPA: RluA family pseudouridine synthase [Gallionella sp.]|nr:RluA family pseudouridine synthase [Gallionella sp.]
MKHIHFPLSDLDLIYRDESLIVVNKQAGLLAVPGRGAGKQDCLASRVQAEFPDALIVHRLDMATSGLLLFARGAEMQRHLSHLFRERLVAKCYVAVVSGRLELLAGEIDLPLTRDWPNRPRQKVDSATGKPSLTRYRVLGYERPVRADPSTGLMTKGFVEAYSVSDHSPFDITSDLPACGLSQMTSSSIKLRVNGLADTTRVELEPVTGRTHQLRVHMAAIGHPILGDALYGEEDSAERLLLHASALSFVHPLGAEPLSFASEPPF